MKSREARTVLQSLQLDGTPEFVENLKSALYQTEDDAFKLLNIKWPMGENPIVLHKEDKVLRGVNVKDKTLRVIDEDIQKIRDKYGIIQEEIKFYDRYKDRLRTDCDLKYSEGVNIDQVLIIEDWNKDNKILLCSTFHSILDDLISLSTYYSNVDIYLQEFHVQGHYILNCKFKEGNIKYISIKEDLSKEELDIYKKLFQKDKYKELMNLREIYLEHLI